jgi:hypothetical protein
MNSILEYLESQLGEEWANEPLENIIASLNNSPYYKVQIDNNNCLGKIRWCLENIGPSIYYGNSIQFYGYDWISTGFSYWFVNLSDAIQFKLIFGGK